MKWSKFKEIQIEGSKNGIFEAIEFMNEPEDIQMAQYLYEIMSNEFHFNKFVSASLVDGIPHDVLERNGYKIIGEQLVSIN